MMINLEQALSQALAKYAAPTSELPSGVIDVEAELVGLLYADEWTTSQLVFFHSWMKKMDVTKTQYLNYDCHWKPSVKKEKISSRHRELSVLMALRYLRSSNCKQAGSGQTMKTINVLFKMLESLESVFNLRQSALVEYLQQLLEVSVPDSCDGTENIAAGGLADKTLPITVLFSEGPIARAYLEAIAAMGLKVNKIIALVSSVDLVSKKPVGGILPKGMKVKYAANKQYKQMFFWPNHYQAKHAKTVEMIRSQLRDKLSFDSTTLQRGSQNRDLHHYTDCVETLFIKGLKDSKLVSKLTAEPDQLFLFTGGGIVPESLLSIEDKKLIHIHPGYLPEVRGADCVLWSQVLHQRTSASAFFLAPGIDVGDVLYPCWLPQIHLNFPKQVDSRVKYRLIYGFFDPWVRSFVLQQLIVATQGLVKLNPIVQNEDDGMTYHFMHEKLKQLAYARFK